MEHPDYRNNLEDILTFTQGRHLLSIGDVQKYTGITNTQTINKRFPMIKGYISAPALARCLCKYKNDFQGIRPWTAPPFC